MSYHRQFERFNPISGDVPHYPFSYLPEVAWRARALLKARTTAQIDAAAKRIDDAIDAYFHHAKETEIYRLECELNAPHRWKHEDTHAYEHAAQFFTWYGETTENGRWVFNDDMEGELDIPTSENTNAVDALKAAIEERDGKFFFNAVEPKPEEYEYPEGKDYELFAVLSLWLLADALHWINHLPSDAIKFFHQEVHIGVNEAFGKDLAPVPIRINEKEINFSLAGECAMKAMDSVCYAEKLYRIGLLESMHAGALSRMHSDYLNKEAERQQNEHHKRSMVAEQLKLARHRKTYEAKEKVITEWKKNPSNFPSAEKAGLHFADWLIPQGFKYEPRTVIGWIRAHAKQVGIKFR